MNQEVTIIILAHKSKKLVMNYIKNLYKKIKIIIVDNSNDTELELLVKNTYPGVSIHLISIFSFSKTPFKESRSFKLNL